MLMLYSMMMSLSAKNTLIKPLIRGHTNAEVIVNENHACEVNVLHGVVLYLDGRVLHFRPASSSQFNRIPCLKNQSKNICARLSLGPRTQF